MTKKAKAAHDKEQSARDSLVERQQLVRIAATTMYAKHTEGSSNIRELIKQSKMHKKEIAALLVMSGASNITGTEKIGDLQDALVAKVTTQAHPNLNVAKFNEFLRIFIDL